MSRDNKLIFWSMLVWGFGEGLWWYLLPIHIGNLGADPVQIGLVLSAGMILMTLTFIPSGWLTDRFSRRTIMIIGWCDGLVAVLLIALARTWQQALPGLILYNLSAFNSPAISSYVAADIKPGQDMRRVFTLVFSGFTIGVTVSPALGGFLADIVGLRQLFLLAAVMYAISTVIIVLIKEQPVHQATHGSEPVSLRGDRVFLSLCALFFIIHLVAHLGIPLSPNFLQDVRKLDLGWIGILGSANGLGAAILTIGLGRWTRGRVTGILIGQLAVGVYAVLMIGTTAVPFLALAFFLRGGLGAVRQLASARLGEMLPPSSMGLGFGIFQTVVNLAFTISPYAAGWLFALDPSFPFLASLVLTLPAMLLTLLVGRQGPHRRRATQ
jgi:MFS family permease